MISYPWYLLFSLWYPWSSYLPMSGPSSMVPFSDFKLWIHRILWDFIRPMISSFYYFLIAKFISNMYLSSATFFVPIICSLYLFCYFFTYVVFTNHNNHTHLLIVSWMLLLRLMRRRIRLRFLDIYKSYVISISNNLYSSSVWLRVSACKKMSVQAIEWLNEYGHSVRLEKHNEPIAKISRWSKQTELCLRDDIRNDQIRTNKYISENRPMRNS